MRQFVVDFMAKLDTRDRITFGGLLLFGVGCAFLSVPAALMAVGAALFYIGIR